MAELAMRCVRDIGYPLPNFTRLVLQPHAWLLFAPGPWVLYSAVLSYRRDLSAGTAFIFAGTVALAMTAVLCAVTVAALLPFIPLHAVQW
jgi:hypothetical protein